jgi:chromosome segregation ATPase
MDDSNSPDNLFNNDDFDLNKIKKGSNKNKRLLNAAHLKIEELESELSNLKENNPNINDVLLLKIKNEQNIKYINELEVKCDELEVKCNEYDKLNTDIVFSCGELESKIKELNEENKSLKDTINSLNESCKTNNELLNKKNGYIEGLSKDIRRFKVDVENLEKELKYRTDQTERIEKLKDYNRKLIFDINDCERRINNLINDNAKLTRINKNDIERLKTANEVKVKYEQTRNLNLDKVNGRLNREIAELKRENAQLHYYLAKLNNDKLNDYPNKRQRSYYDHYDKNKNESEEGLVVEFKNEL